MQVRQAGEQHAVVNCQHFVRSWQVGPRRPGLDEFDHAVANSYDSRSIKTGCRADKPRCRDQQVVSSLEMFEFKRRIQTKHCMPGNSIAFATETSRRSVDRLRTRALKKYGGAAGNRTPDLVIANDALSQLSYSPPARTSLLGFPPDTSDIGRAGIEFRPFSA